MKTDRFRNILMHILVTAITAMTTLLIAMIVWAIVMIGKAIWVTITQ